MRYEQMIAQLNQRSMQEKLIPFQVTKALQAASPSTEFVEMHGGHYRIGAKTNPEAMDKELPTQVVDLSSYRIHKHPVSNAEWLGFMQAGGYSNQNLWTEVGWQWLQKAEVECPIY